MLKQKVIRHFILDFSRGIVILLNRIIYTIHQNNIILTFEELLEVKKFYESLRNYPESNDPELKIKDVIKLLDLEVKMSLTNIKPLKIYNNNEFYLNAKSPIIPEKISDIFDILEWSEYEIARQITLITQFLFLKIEVKELISSNWTKPDKYKISPSIMKLIDRFNNLSLWICEEILSYDYKETRAKVIEKFLKIANICRKLNNFNDCINVVTSLNSLPVKILKKSWEIVLKNSENAFLLKELNSLCSYSKNYAAIRYETSLAKGQTCIPYLGLYLKSLAFFEEGPKYINDRYMINIEKIRKVGEKIQEIIDFQEKHYNFKQVFRLNFLADTKPKNEEILIEISAKLGKIKLIF